MLHTSEQQRRQLTAGPNIAHRESSRILCVHLFALTCLLPPSPAVAVTKGPIVAKKPAVTHYLLSDIEASKYRPLWLKPSSTTDVPDSENRTHRELSSTLSVYRAISFTRPDLNEFPLGLPPKTEHILSYLAKVEEMEPDVWIRDDIRIAWLTVRWAADESRQWSADFGPWEFSFSTYLGKHPKKLIPEFVARAARHAAMESEATSCTNMGTPREPMLLANPEVPLQRCETAGGRIAAQLNKAVPEVLTCGLDAASALPQKKPVRSETSPKSSPRRRTA